MLKIAERAISTMNYLFLRSVSGRESIEAVDEELASYVNHLTEEYIHLPEAVTRDIHTEIIEGEYFKGMSETDVKQKITAFVTPMIETPGNEQIVVDFYMSYFKTPLTPNN